MHRSNMRKFHRFVVQRTQDFGKIVNPRVSNSIRTIELYEKEERSEEESDKRNPDRTLYELHGNGLVSSSALQPGRNFCRLSGTKIHIRNPRNTKSSNIRIGFYRGLETASKLERDGTVERAFEAAITVDELEIAFREMESVFDGDDKRLGMACLRMGQELESAGENSETIIAYANKALRILEKDDKSCITVATSLYLLGSVHYKLGKFDESLVYSSRAIGKFENERSQFQNTPLVHDIRCLLGDVKTALGRREEALRYYIRCLQLKEEQLDPDHPQLAGVSKKVAEAYVDVLNFKEALNLCLNSLKIDRKHLGENSVELAMDQRLLAAIYAGLGEYEKALQQNEAAKRVFKIWDMKKELIDSELDSANLQIFLGRYDDALNMLKGIFQQTDNESELQAMVLLYMGKALCNLKNYGESKKCCELASKTFKMHSQTSPEKVGEAFTEIAMLYEMMNDFGAAITFYKMALEIYEVSPKYQHAEGSTAGRLGWLLLMTGSVKDSISYLESAVQKMKESFGSQHFGVGYIYNNLGLAYAELEKPSAAARMFEMAKGVMEIGLGSQHMDTIETIQSLANMHGLMGSFELAIGFQRKVIEALENNGPCAMDELREARHHLAYLERWARQSEGIPS